MPFTCLIGSLMKWKVASINQVLQSYSSLFITGGEKSDVWHGLYLIHRKLLLRQNLL
jgi:hypothetical protein